MKKERELSELEADVLRLVCDGTDEDTDTTEDALARMIDWISQARTDATLVGMWDKGELYIVFDHGEIKFKLKKPAYEKMKAETEKR